MHSVQVAGQQAEKARDAQERSVVSKLDRVKTDQARRAEALAKEAEDAELRVGALLSPSTLLIAHFMKHQNGRLRKLFQDPEGFLEVAYGRRSLLLSRCPVHAQQIALAPTCVLGSATAGAPVGNCSALLLNSAQSICNMAMVACILVSIYQGRTMQLLVAYFHAEVINGGKQRCLVQNDSTFLAEASSGGHCKER